MVVPGPEQTITFVRQERGPYAGAWLLPGGKLEFGQSPEDTARREALEEAGCVVGSMSGIGLYDMRGQWAQGPYCVRARSIRIRLMQILNDAGVANYPQADVNAKLARDGIVMTRYLARTLTSDFGVLADR